MKKSLLALALLFSIQSFSQEYIPMLQDGNEWGTQVCGVFDCFGFQLTEITGEETHNGLTYKVMGENSCLLREENGIVYVLNEDLSEDIFLDFTLEIGDIFNPAPIRDNCLNIDIAEIEDFEVVDVQTVSILGFDRKVITLEYLIFQENEYWIEGIGSTKSIGPGGFIFDAGMKLHCFTNNGQTIIISGNTITETNEGCVAPPLSVDEFLLSQIKMTPNPVTEIGILTIPQEIVFPNIVVFDLNGKQLMEKEISEKNTSLDFSSLASGMYFYSIHAENELILTKKLLVK